MALHNYSRKHAKHDEEFDEAYNNNNYIQFIASDLNHKNIIQEPIPNIVAQDDSFLAQVHDRIRNLLMDR